MLNVFGTDETILQYYGSTQAIPYKIFVCSGLNVLNMSKEYVYIQLYALSSPMCKMPLWLVLVRCSNITIFSEFRVWFMP